MGNYEEKILITLAEKYRRSKKDSGTNVTARRTRVLPRELYKKYNQNDGDLEQIGALNQAALRCRELGFVTYEMQGFSSEIQAIYLVDEQIGAVEAYLTERYQYESKSAKIKYIEGILAKYGGKSPAAERECEKLRQALAKNRIPAKYLQTEELLQEQLDSLDSYLGEGWTTEYEILYTEDLKGDDLDAIKDSYEDADIKVSAAKTVEVEMTVKADETESSNTLEISLIKVGRSWYLDMMNMGGLF